MQSQRDWLSTVIPQAIHLRNASFVYCCCFVESENIVIAAWAVHMKKLEVYLEKRFFFTNPKGSRIIYTQDSVWYAYHLAQKNLQILVES